MPRPYQKDYSVHHYSFACKDFNGTTLERLMKLQASIIGLEMIPDETTMAPWANATKGYILIVGPLTAPRARHLFTFSQVINFSHSILEETPVASH